MAILGLKNAGQEPDPPGLRRRHPQDQRRPYDGAGLSVQPLDLSYEAFGTIARPACTWFVSVKDGKFVVLNKGKTVTGKLVGDAALIKKYESNAGTGSGHDDRSAVDVGHAPQPGPRAPRSPEGEPHRLPLGSVREERQRTALRRAGGDWGVPRHAH